MSNLFRNSMGMKKRVIAVFLAITMFFASVYSDCTFSYANGTEDVIEENVMEAVSDLSFNDLVDITANDDDKQDASVEEGLLEDSVYAEEEGEGTIGVDLPGTITNTYTLDATNDLTAFAGGKADGDSEEVGGYFTVIYSSKSKVDASTKTFEDGYEATQRINFGGGASSEKNSVKITTTTSNAKVKVWWAEGGDDNRQIAILNSSGSEVVSSNLTLAKNAVAISEFTLEEKGTYFIGNQGKNNYIFKIEVKESVTYVWEEKENVLDAGTDLTAFAAGKADGDSEKVGEYFTVIYSSKSKVDASSKTFEDGYAATQRINFGGIASTAKNSIKITTTGANSKVKVWWVEGGDDNRQIRILNSEGNEVTSTNVTLAKNATAISELTIPEAGTYYIGNKGNNNYIFKISVKEKILVSGEEEEVIPRKAWEEVASPVITNVAATEGTANIGVTVNALVGYDGADKVSVTMKDLSGNELETRNSIAEKDSHELSFTGTDTGLYTFVPSSSRDGENVVKTGAESDALYFVLPLSAPSLKSVTSKGEGKVEVEWDAVKEASGYIVTVNGEDASEEIKADADLKVMLNLNVGEEYTFGVKALRTRVNPLTKEEVNDISAIGKTIKAKVVDEVQRTWGYSVYGTSTDTKNNGYIGSINDGSVTVYSEGGKGKIVPGSTDGISFYYTKIDPATENFTLEAEINVDSWTLSNGQEGFGMMVSDTIGVNGSTDTVWNNSYMVLGSKVEYEDEKTDSDGEVYTDKISMKLGLGVLTRTGVTAEDIKNFKKTGKFLDSNGKEVAIPEGFESNNAAYTLEKSCANLGAGTYNIIGNYTAEPTGTQTDKLITKVIFSITRNNTGYILQYKNEDGDVIGSKTIYDLARNSLTQIDADNIYVGFFASRNARITVSNMTFTTINPGDDAPAEEPETEYVAPSYKIESATIANSEDYELVYYGNGDGKITVKDSNGKVICSDKEVTAFTKTAIPTKITAGTTTFTVSMTPNPEFVFGEYKKLSSYATKTFTHSVTYKVFEATNIYVAPNGTANGYGTKQNPLDIYTAVKYVRPGQKILLAGGTYNLSKTVKVERGIDGNEGSRIYMIADPEAESRPVLDFNGKSAGMVLAGNYWYFKGFDVTRSQDATKGVQVSGSNNILEDIYTYKNGNTGIQISRYLSSDLKDQWPANNLILNCTSFLNADKGYEDADGFAAKLTIGEGNVFDGCISAYNADDGWDLYAKVQTGAIGKVVIKNSVAFMNGYVLDAEGNKVNAGNGNGFKMGGESLSGYHTLINSIAFMNKAKGIDSNSCPDIQVYNSTSYNNESYNVAFYTNNATKTDFLADGVLSYKNSNTVPEQIKPVGGQDASKYKNATSFLFDGSQSVNSANVKVEDNWFANLDADSVVEAFKIFINTHEFATVNGTGITRNADGSINTNGFLALSENGSEKGGKGASLGVSNEPAKEDALYNIEVKEGISEELAKSYLNKEDATLEELKDTLIAELWKSEGFSAKLTNADVKNVAFYQLDMTVLKNGVYEPVSSANVSENYISATIAKPYGTDIENYKFVSLVKEFVTDEKTVFTGSRVEDTSIVASDLSVSLKTGAILLVAYEAKERVEDEIWGDIIEEDRLLFASSEDVPENSLWIAGIKDVDYTGSPVTFDVRVYHGKTLLKKNADYKISYKNNKNAHNAEGKSAPAVIIEAKGNYVGKITKNFAINPIDISKSSEYVSQFTTSEPVLAYNGKVQKANVVLYRKGKALSAKADYTLSYPETGENAYKATGSYSVLVTGKGNYTGNITVKETITDKKLISKASVDRIANQKYTGETIIPTLKISMSGKKLTGISDTEFSKLKKGEKSAYDYTYTVSDNVEIGTATILITGQNNYIGTKTITFKITGTKISASMVKNFKSSLPYTGSAVFEDCKLEYRNKSLKGSSKQAYEAMPVEKQKEVDYVYEYSNNVEIGKATVTFTGVNAFYGTVKKTFNITGIALSKAKLSGVSNAIYSGRQITQDKAVITYTSGKGTEKTTKILVEGVDYTVSYKNNVKAGTATAIYNGKGLYTGTIKKNFTISKYDLAKDSNGRISLIYSDKVAYAKKGAYNNVTVVYTYKGVETTLSEGIDYKLSFLNNDKVCTSLEGVSKKPTIVITGKGSFSGVRKAEFFTIEKRSIATVGVNAKDVQASGKAGLKSDIVITDRQLNGYTAGGEGIYNNNKLVAGKDYKVEGLYYVNETNITRKNSSVTVTVTAGEKVTADDIVPAGTEIRAKIAGSGNFDGTTDAVYRVSKVLLSTATCSLTEPVYYTGKEIVLDANKLKVTVGSGKNKRTLEAGKDFLYETINDVSGRKITVILYGIGDFGGSKKVEIKVSRKLFELFK